MNKHLSSRKRKSNLAPKQHCTLPLNCVFENVSVSKKSFIISALFVVWKPILFALKQKAFCTEVKKNNIYRRTWRHCLHHIFIRIWIGVIHRLTGFTYCCWSDSSEFQRNNVLIQQIKNLMNMLISLYESFCNTAVRKFLFSHSFQQIEETHILVVFHLTLKPYFKSLLVDLKYVYTKSGVVHSGNNVWWKYH